MFGKFITKISIFLFSDINKIISPYFKNLSKVLNYANIGEDINSYLCNALFISFISAIVLEFLMIFIMLKINIFFTILSFLITIFLSFTFAAIIFFVFYKYPFYLINSKKKEVEFEIKNSLKHLSALRDKDLTVRDILLLLQKLEFNSILTIECKKVLSMSSINKNLRGTLEFICKNTYSELEYDFFKKLIDVIDNKKILSDVITEFLENVEQSIKSQNEQRKTKINLLFQVNIFLFFLIFILVFGVFLTSMFIPQMHSILLMIAIIFPIIEIILIIVLNK
jgi:hypothetical protein